MPKGHGTGYRKATQTEMFEDTIRDGKTDTGAEAGAFAVKPKSA